MVRSCDLLQNFGGSNHITGMAEPKVIQFCTQVGYINSSNRMTYHQQKGHGYGHVTVSRFCRLSWCSASRGFVSDSWTSCFEWWECNNCWSVTVSYQWCLVVCWWIRLCIMIHVVAELVTGTVCFGLNTLPLDTILLLRLLFCRFTLLNSKLTEYLLKYTICRFTWAAVALQSENGFPFE